MKKLALVLGGGAAKGYAHIGVLKVLEKHGIKPDLIVGTSMGALVGGMYAAGKSVEDMTNLGRKFNSIGNFSLISALFKGNLINTSRVKKILDRELGEITHENCPIKFVSIAAELTTGDEKHFTSGLMRESIMASISIPGVFPSVQIGENSYCDGGILNNLAENVAREIMPDAVVVSVDVLGDYKKIYEKSKFKILSTFINANTLMLTNAVKNKPVLADVRITVTQPTVHQLDFSSKNVNRIISHGVKEANKKIKEIKSLLGDTNEKTIKTNSKRINKR